MPVDAEVPGSRPGFRGCVKCYSNGFWSGIPERALKTRAARVAEKIEDPYTAVDALLAQVRWPKWRVKCGCRNRSFGHRGSRSGRIAAVLHGGAGDGSRECAKR